MEFVWQSSAPGHGDWPGGIHPVTFHWRKQVPSTKTFLVEGGASCPVHLGFFFFLTSLNLCRSYGYCHKISAHSYMYQLWLIDAVFWESFTTCSSNKLSASPFAQTPESWSGEIDEDILFRAVNFKIFHSLPIVCLCVSVHYHLLQQVSLMRAKWYSDLSV